jgi:hypothetical protein
MALLAARLGFDAVPPKPDAKIMQVFANGHRIEAEVLEKYPAVDRQWEVRLPVTGRIHVVGHIDGVISWPHDSADVVPNIDVSKDRLVEVKSQSREEWDRFAADGWETGFFPKYKWQVSCYMHASGLPLTLIRALRDEDGNWTGETNISYVDAPFYSIAEIRARVLRVEAAAATGVLNATCTPSFPCPYFYLHDEIDRELITDDGVDILAREYAEASRDENIARDRKTNAKRALRVAVESDKYETSSGVKVTFYRAANPPRLDKEFLEPFLKEHDRSLSDFMILGTSERVRVTLPSEKKDEKDGDTDG